MCIRDRLNIEHSWANADGAYPLSQEVVLDSSVRISFINWYFSFHSFYLSLSSFYEIASPAFAGAGLLLSSHPTYYLSLIHISEPTRLGMISYAVFCLKKKKE